MSYNLGKYIREKREAFRGKDPSYSLRQVAARIGIEPSYLSKIERGEQTYLSEEKILALARELNEDECMANKGIWNNNYEPPCMLPVFYGERGFVNQLLLDPMKLTEEECLANGGEWGIWYLTDKPPWCNLPTLDGGLECYDSSQCESWCQAKEYAKTGSQDTGTCNEKYFDSCFKDGITPPSTPRIKTADSKPDILARCVYTGG